MAIAVIGCILPLALSALLHALQLGNGDIDSLLIINQLVNYKAIDSNDISNKQELLKKWQNELIAGGDNFKIKKTAAKVCISNIKVKGFWCA